MRCLVLLQFLQLVSELGSASGNLTEVTLQQTLLSLFETYLFGATDSGVHMELSVQHLYC